MQSGKEAFLGMDKRSRKTQEAISKAFKELVKEKGGISKVSVRDIANCANISRSTFYSHYDDIDDLTEFMKEDIAADLSDIISRHVQNPDPSASAFETIQALLLDILTYLVQQDFLTQEIIANSRNNGITVSLSENICELVREQAVKSCSPVDSDVLKDTSLFLTYGCAGMIKNWFLNRSSSSPEVTAKKMAESINSLVSIYSGNRH